MDNGEPRRHTLKAWGKYRIAPRGNPLPYDNLPMCGHTLDKIYEEVFSDIPIDINITFESTVRWNDSYYRMWMAISPPSSKEE